MTWMHGENLILTDRIVVRQDVVLKHTSFSRCSRTPYDWNCSAGVSTSGTDGLKRNRDGAERRCTMVFLWTWRCVVPLELGLKRLSIFAYRLTVNTNDRFIGLTSIDYRDLGHWAILVAFAKKLNSKQRLSTIVISCHSLTSQQPVWWSVAG